MDEQEIVKVLNPNFQYALTKDERLVIMDHSRRLYYNISRHHQRTAVEGRILFLSEPKTNRLGSNCLFFGGTHRVGKRPAQLHSDVPKGIDCYLTVYREVFTTHSVKSPLALRIIPTTEEFDIPDHLDTNLKSWLRTYGLA